MQKEYLALFSVLLSFLIGFSFYFKGKNKKIRIHFLFFALVITLWSFSLYLYHNQQLLSALDWIKIIIFLTIVSIFGLLCLIIAISKRSLKEFKTFLSVFFALNALIISALFIKGRIFELAPFPPLVTFFLLLFIYGAWIAIILFERTLKTSSTEHLQAISILISFGLFITAIAVLNVFIPLILGLVNYSWLNPVFSLFLVSFIAFIIGRYYFLKTRAIWVEFSVGLMGATLLVLPFLMPSLNLKIFTSVIFFLFCIIGYYLIKITSEESKRRKEAERLVEERRKLNLARDQFILSFQHHLRTPLVPVRGYLEMILKGAYGRVENPLIREKLIEIRKRVNTLYSLIEGLLDVQELRTGKKNLNLEDCQIDNLIESIIEELKPEAEGKGLYLNFEKDLLPTTIKIDKQKIRVAIRNLVDNAIKYTNEGGVTIISKIEDEKLKISLSDTGIGMKKEEIDYFLKGQLLERGERAKKLYGPGRGIGLTLAIEFIKSHKGKIWAESKGQDQGTTFWIEIPFKK